MASTNSSKPEWTPSQILVGLPVLGFCVDFILNGVLKVIWFPIYATVYFGLAVSFYNYFHKSRLRPWATGASCLFLTGTALGHLFWTGRAELRTYSMSIVSQSPFELRAPEFSDTLFVMSDKLLAKLGDQTALGSPPVPVTIEVIKDYGCIRSFKVARVAGVDVMKDPGANWVWRPADRQTTEERAASAHVLKAGIEEENQRLLWCRIKWF
jgi:hypothetical protein